jgi:vacuolar-type H+-ATPase subunit H
MNVLALTPKAPTAPEPTVVNDRPGARTTPDDSPSNALERLEAIRTEASDRLTRDLTNVRSALTACYDAVARLDETQWVPFDLVSRLVQELSASASAERERANGLAAALEAAKHDAVRAQSETQRAIEAAREEAARERKEIVNRAERELLETRKQMQAAVSAESRLQSDLGATRDRFQQIVEAQMLQLMTFRKEIEQATPKGDRPRPVTLVPAAREPAPPPKPPEATVASIGARIERRRGTEAPAFDAIEAVLADSPPLGRWPTTPAV